MNETLLIPINNIKVEDRQRQDLGDIDALAESIARFGLIQPIVINQDSRLIAGGRRLAATIKLGWPSIKCVFVETLSDDFLAELELEENIRRKEMNWRERVLAIASIHAKKLAAHGFDSQEWGQAETGELLGLATGHINYALTVAAILKQPENPLFKVIANAESIWDALKLLAQDKEDSYLLELSKRTAANKETAPTDDFLSLYTDDEEDTVAVTNEAGELVAKPKRKVYITTHLTHGDCISVLREMPTEWVHHIVCDPPYAIEMDNLEQENTGMDVSRVRDAHEVDENLILLANFFPEAFRILKPGGFCVLWCDVMNWEYLHFHASGAGFRVQRWPIIWDKGTSMNQAAGYNFTKSFECAMVCRLPGATLQKPSPRCVIQSPIDMAAKSLGNTFAKPALVNQFIIEHISAPSQTILDPFAGSGSILLAAMDIDRYAFGIEKDDKHFPVLMENVKQWYLSRDPNTIFV